MITVTNFLKRNSVPGQHHICTLQDTEIVRNPDGSVAAIDLYLHRMQDDRTMQVSIAGDDLERLKEIFDNG